MKKIKYTALLLAMLCLGSCEKSFLDVNTDPNSPTDASISSDLLLPSALLKTSQFTTASTRGTFGTFARWCGVWCPSTDFAAGEESKYTRIPSTANGTWFSIYDQNQEFKAIETKSTATGETFYQGIALIMQSLNFQMGVDMFNDMPYSEANNALILTPKYDKGEDIYMDLLKKIDQGITLIKNADASKNFNLANGDILRVSTNGLNSSPTINGDRKEKWIKFANTLKLRILIHMSQMPNINTIATAELAKINAEGSGFLGVGENIGANPGFIIAKPNNFWNTFTYDLANNFPNTFNRANNFSLGIMKTLNDERYKYFYKPVQGTPGTLPSHWVGNDYAPINSDPAKRASVTSDIGGSLTSAGDTKGLSKSAIMDNWIMTAAESLFLQAEAKARGWNVDGTALGLYQSGVIESFTWLGAPGANAYLAQADPRIAFGSTLNDNLRAIAWQKYFAFNGNSLLEIYNDYRRLADLITGVPYVNIPPSLDPGAGSNKIPVRLPYPQTEFDFNTANVTAAGGLVNIQTSTVFWDR